MFYQGGMPYFRHPWMCGGGGVCKTKYATVHTWRYIVSCPVFLVYMCAGTFGGGARVGAESILFSVIWSFCDAGVAFNMFASVLNAAISSTPGGGNGKVRSGLVRTSIDSFAATMAASVLFVFGISHSYRTKIDCLCDWFHSCFAYVAAVAPKTFRCMTRVPALNCVWHLYSPFCQDIIDQYFGSSQNISAY